MGIILCFTYNIEIAFAIAVCDYKLNYSTLSFYFLASLDFFCLGKFIISS